MSVKICKRMCKTCIFGKNSPVSSKRLMSLIQEWHANRSHQICHSFGTSDVDENINGEDVVCRGYYENVYMNEDSPVAPSGLLQMCERGGVPFVFVEPEGP